MKQRKRPIRVVFYLKEDEQALMNKKMQAANIQNREAYIRKMVLDGYILRLDFTDVKRMVFLLSNATNNLNQIAKRVNESGSMFAEDVRTL
ncbi:MAG: plasmid mobilization relaxosome protein MobC, partial [Oscillospiraceae bacterium]|nr:plasmid mobilization relaxosome protein MobC [Oscillospiraceae bacterium]